MKKGGQCPVLLVDVVKQPSHKKFHHAGGDLGLVAHVRVHKSVDLGSHIVMDAFVPVNACPNLSLCLVIARAQLGWPKAQTEWPRQRHGGFLGMAGKAPSRETSRCTVLAVA